MLILFNTKGATGLGINTIGTAVYVWKSITSLYKGTSEITTLNGKQKLWNLKYSDNNDFPSHITLLRNKLAYARTLGAEISDKSFITIIFNSFPLSWDPVITLASKILAK